MLSSQKLFPGSFLSHSFPSYRFCDTETIPPIVQRLCVKKMISRIFHLFLINPYNRKTSTLTTITSNWGKKNFRSHRISGAALCILNELFYHNSTRGSLPRKTSLEMIDINGNSSFSRRIYKYTERRVQWNYDLLRKSRWTWQPGENLVESKGLDKCNEAVCS